MDQTWSSPSQRGSHTPKRLSMLAGSGTEASEDEAPVQIPRGKLVARLQAQLHNESSESSDDDGAAAYERVKQLLGHGVNQKQSDKKPVQSIRAEASISEDEDDMPVRPTKSHRLTARRTASSPPPPSLSPRQPPYSRMSSPGLFVSPEPSPAKSRSETRTLSESNDEEEDNTNVDLQLRVERIRAERKARQLEEAKQKRLSRNPRRAGSDSDSDSDGENGRRLTQQSKPTRRAGKKALEQMARDQQRISRNMQLTHQAKTKKKYGPKDLLARFGYNQLESELVPAGNLPTPDASSVLAPSDAEGFPARDTPPTSPPSEADSTTKLNDSTAVMSGDITMATEDKGCSVALVSVNDLAPTRVDKGKGRAPEFQHVPVNPLAAPNRPVIIARRADMEPKATEDNVAELSDSDDDLEIVEPTSKFSVFDRLPEKKKREAPSILHLRHLAHLTSPNKRAPKGQKTTNLAELQVSLFRKARQQAQKERQEKIEDLKRRGIHIETEEEREKQQLEVADMVEKARLEDLKLRKLEKEQAKQSGELGDGLPSSDESEDEDYVGSGEDDGDQVEEIEEAELELSGSEDDEAVDEEEEVDGEANDLVDQEAEDDEEGNEEMDDVAQAEEPGDEEDADDDLPSVRRYRGLTGRARNVVVDEDDSADETPVQPTAKAFLGSLQTKEGTQAGDMAASFGFNNADTGLGLTQMFAGTMANLESDSQTAHPLDREPEQDSLDFLRGLPDTQPDYFPASTPQLLVPNSQFLDTEKEDPQAGAASQLQLGISQRGETSPAFSHTQLSEMPEPTQDAGFELSRSPGLIPPASTIDTVAMSVAESPTLKRKGRLQRRSEMVTTVDEGWEPSEAEHSDAEPVSHGKNAFSVLKKAATKRAKIDDFNKKTSWAKDAVMEQAEESEDEYAGLGGASDDDSGEEDEELAKMIDTNDVKVDERKLAAFFAEKAKAEDDIGLKKLFKDITTGNFRKRRGGDAFDMSDSEDEALQRQRKKQMAFKQMTKALMADERIGKIAQNPKQAAFFKSLADHDDDADVDFLNAPDPEADSESSNTQTPSNEETEATLEVAVPDSQTVETAPSNPLKRKVSESQEKENRPPPNLRRTAASDGLTRKPMSFADVQHSISELVEDPRMMNMVPDSQYSDSEDESEAPLSNSRSRKPIIDRLRLSRSTTMESNDGTGNMAFHAPSAGVNAPGFRIPSLLRRATSNLSTGTTTSTTTGTTAETTTVRRGGSGKSNIHAQAREAERRAAVEKSEARRRESLKKKVGRARGKRSVLGSLDVGFE